MSFSYVKHQQLPLFTKKIRAMQAIPKGKHPAEKPVDTNYARQVQKVPTPKDYYNTSDAYQASNDGHIFTGMMTFMMRVMTKITETSHHPSPAYEEPVKLPIPIASTWWHLYGGVSIHNELFRRLGGESHSPY